MVQNEVLDAMFEKPGYDRTKNRRLYSESPLGLPGNGDLCETIVALNDGTVRSVWFDLHMVTRIMSQKQQDSVPKAPPVTLQSNHSATTLFRSLLEDSLDLLTARECNVEERFIAGYQAIANKGKTAVIIFAISLVCLGIAWVGALEDNSMSKMAWLGLLSYIVGLVYYAKFRRIVRGLHGAVIGVILLIVAPFLIFAFIRMDYRAFKEELERVMLKMDWKGRVEPRF